jgi:formaldehyde-activating enzyme involved in methanogenesis
MSIFKQFKTTDTGVWIEYPENADGTIPSFKIARMSKTNKIYQKTLEEMVRPYKREIELNLLKQDKDDEIMLDVFVACILIDWKNIKDESGGSYAFTKANAKALMQELPELYEDLKDRARNMTYFLEKEKESVIKN